MPRILKKYTTIPQDLYVNRAADIQLKNIIEDMQRPGYVLVARQMGKTNLLFNAKRQLESKDRMFAYVDMSNVYKKERECYQNIIDCIVEPNDDFLSDAEEKIDIIREKKLPPHKEYMRSLRVILKIIPGSLVIILDEIDALKTSDYSDKIFAQIRSNYFSRTSFPEFENLTYVLSGVIEPTELIQDRNKSPFNIGDKIYLDDFNKDEYLTFIEKSNLKVSNEIIDHIYSWVNGNPRLMFDVCSEVESYLIDNGEISTGIIDDIIHTKYLTNFDLAPIDHIRELVKDNIDVVNYLIDIQNNSNSKLDDDLHKKLYLFGVVSSKAEASCLFKNKIIEESLNIDWLNSIKSTHSKKSQTLPHALGEFDLQNYDETIIILESLLENGQNEKDMETILYFLGWSYNKIGDYVKAVERLSYNFTDSIVNSRSKCISGISSILNGDIDTGVANLRLLLESKDDFSKHNAMLNLARIESNNENSLALYEKLFESASNPDENSDGVTNNSFCCASLYFQHEIYVEKGHISFAIDALNHALNYSSNPESFLLKFSLAKISSKNVDLCKEIIDDIVTQNITFEQGINELGMGFSPSILSNFVNYSINEVNHEYFLKLYNYIQSKLFKSNKDLID
ncbi:AAA-like domain-containing protein, partial [Vibrio sp. F13]|uniref:AAA-like domain-containing protein n=1 Tax=Vibrio sp. F13 TaxID=2070777 RepID=UPI0010BD7390